MKISHGYVEVVRGNGKWLNAMKKRRQMASENGFFSGVNIQNAPDSECWPCKRLFVCVPVQSVVLSDECNFEYNTLL